MSHADPGQEAARARRFPVAVVWMAGAFGFTLSAITRHDVHVAWYRCPGLTRRVPKNKM